MIKMKFDLCIGGNEVFWEFKDAEHRDSVWDRLLTTHGWQLVWASKRGDERSARQHIVFHVEQIPTSYRWHCVFDEASDPKGADSVLVL